MQLTTTHELLLAHAEAGTPLFLGPGMWEVITPLINAGLMEVVVDNEIGYPSATFLGEVVAREPQMLVADKWGSEAFN